jgi:ketosteroid isomerase-like protein
MKRISTIAVGSILILTCMAGLWAQDDAALRKQVTELYDKTNQYYAAKDINGFMSLMTDDFQMIYVGVGREAVRSGFEAYFKQADQLRTNYTISEISPFGNMIKVICDSKIEGKTGTEDWKVLYQGGAIDFLVKRDGALKIARSSTYDKLRTGNIHGQTYTDKQAGFSFSAPDGWLILPASSQYVQGMVYVLAPDATSVADLGYVPTSSITPRQGIEGDEAITEKLSMEGAYKLFKSGPVSIGGHAGFETESRFFIQTTQDRYRRRVYFNAGGKLYPFCFDAIPPAQWNKVKEGFQSILDSVKVEE